MILNLDQANQVNSSRTITGALVKFCFAISTSVQPTAKEEQINANI